MYALITGASSGIGRELSILLAKRGYDVILVARREQRITDLKRSLEKKYGVRAVAEPCDLSEQQNCIRLFKKYVRYPISILVNNAGFGKVANCLEVPLKTDLEMIQTDLLAPLILTKLFARHMKRGLILNVASMAAFQPSPMLTVYSSAKAALFHYSLALNYELKRRKRPVHISTLCPGPVRTEFNEVAGADMALGSISARQCAKAAVKGMFRKQDLIIPTLPMKLLYAASRLSPLTLTLPLEYEVQTLKL